MKPTTSKQSSTVLFGLLFILLAMLGQTVNSAAQTFRGGINGTVTDNSGAVIPGAIVTVLSVDTGQTKSAPSSSAGDFLFQDLPLGKYSVTVSATGFSTIKTDDIMVSAGSTYTLSIKLPISASSQTVEVEAAGVALDTTSVTQTTDITSDVVNSTPMNGRDFTQLISVAPGFAGYSAGGFGSVNGTRANQVNWQIDGVDNNDLWHNVPSVNQGGVEGIAGITLPLDSIEQYSQQTQSTAESGRNPGGLVNVVTKSGTNQIHGSLYYFNRNELFSANSPFANGAPKSKLRNQQYGVSFGGPVIKDKLFYFFNYEKQQFIINSPSTTTEPTTAFQTDAINLLNEFGIAQPTSVATASLAAFYPSSILNCPTVNSSCDSVNNYTSAAPIVGYSYNGVGKVDYTITPKHTLALRMFGGQGSQIAPVGTIDPYFFEEGPIHVYNWSAVLNSVITPRFTNQVLLGVNYFNQVFFDQNHSQDPESFGFNTGAPQPSLSGAPGIKIQGYDNLQNATPPSGRNDITGQITDSASVIFGKHELRFAGEYRRGYVNEFYHRKERGNFSFPGTQGPWGYVADPTASDFGFQSAACQTAYGYTTPTAAQQAYVNSLPASNSEQILSLADFLIGCTQQAQIVYGDTVRSVYVNSFSGSAADAFQVTKSLNINYGLRWDYLGPMHDDQKDLSVFRPTNPNATNGIVFQGAGIDSLFPHTYHDFAPRFGFSYQPPMSSGLVLRGGVGMFFDQPNLNPFLDNRPPNGGASGAESNPGGPSQVQSLSNNNVVILPNVPLFPVTQPDYNLFSISDNLRPAYTFNFNLNIEQTLGSKAIFTLGYVGSQSRKLLSNIDINPPALGTSASGTAAQNLTRPYGALFPNYGTINQVSSIGNSNYSSLQTTLRTTNLHGLTSQFSYTWSHGLDILTQYRNANITNPLDPKFDYGNMDYDTPNAFVSYVTYDIPGSSHLKPLSSGWQLNSLLTFHSGQPYSIYTGSDTSGTGEGEDRVDVVPGVSPYAGSNHAIVGGVVQWITSGAYTAPSTYSYGDIRRNQLHAPGYGDVDFSVFKNNTFAVMDHKITTQFRVEMFNLFNRANYAPPDNYIGDGAAFGTITSTIGYYNGAPGIGPGEPFNTQFALKILF